MTYRVPLPVGGRLRSLDIVDASSSAVQREIRWNGLSSYEPSTAAALLASFEQLGPGFVFYDVGANVGLYAAMAAAIFEPSSVSAFEPTPAVADIAESIARANALTVEIVRAAVSDTNGHADLHLSPTGDSSNSLNPDFRSGTEAVRVPLLRLDDFAMRSGTVPDIVKIDVETHEAAVLRGARQILEESRPILVVEVLSGRQGRDFAREVGDAIAGLGYSMYELVGEPTFEAEPALFSSRGATRDWMLTPEPLGADFPGRWATWSERLGACTPDRNQRPAILPAVRRAWNRGGFGEIGATARRARDRWVARRRP